VLLRTRQKKPVQQQYENEVQYGLRSKRQQIPIHDIGTPKLELFYVYDVNEDSLMATTIQPTVIIHISVCSVSESMRKILVI
jgi:hypothetical protein